MNPKFRWITLFLIIACLLPLVGCSPAVVGGEEVQKTITIENLGTANEPTREILSADAVKRLDIQTTQVRDVQVTSGQRKAVPYSAILYDTQGNTWTYTSPEPFTYVRHQVTVEDIDGEDAILSDNSLAAGIQVVIQGAEELFGAELEFEEE
jgi:hypothetical protein